MSDVWIFAWYMLRRRFSCSSLWTHWLQSPGIELVLVFHARWILNRFPGELVMRMWQWFIDSSMHVFLLIYACFSAAAAWCDSSSLSSRCCTLAKAMIHQKMSGGRICAYWKRCPLYFAVNWLEDIIRSLVFRGLALSDLVWTWCIRNLPPHADQIFFYYERSKSISCISCKFCGSWEPISVRRRRENSICLGLFVICMAQ